MPNVKIEQLNVLIMPKKNLFFFLKGAEHTAGLNMDIINTTKRSVNLKINNTVISVYLNN